MLLLSGIVYPRGLDRSSYGYGRIYQKGAIMTVYTTTRNTPFWRVLPDNTVKGDDGVIPVGTEIDILNIITHNGKEYGVINGDLDLPGWIVTGRFDYCVFASDIELGTIPDPDPGVALKHVIKVYEDALVEVYDDQGNLLWKSV